MVQSFRPSQQELHSIIQKLSFLQDEEKKYILYQISICSEEQCTFLKTKIEAIIQSYEDKTRGIDEEFEKQKKTMLADIEKEIRRVEKIVEGEVQKSDKNVAEDELLSISNK